MKYIQKIIFSMLVLCGIQSRIGTVSLDHRYVHGVMAAWVVSQALSRSLSLSDPSSDEPYAITKACKKGYSFLVESQRKWFQMIFLERFHGRQPIDDLRDYFFQLLFSVDPFNVKAHLAFERMNFPKFLNDTVQSRNHVLNHPDCVYRLLRNQRFDDPRNILIKSVLERLFAKEAELSNEYYTFIHAQRAVYLLAEQWYTWLKEAKHGLDFERDFICAHVRPENSSEHQEQKIHRKLMANGRKNFHSDAERDRLLFLNYALFGNSTWDGSCSFSYFSNNCNVNYVYSSIADAFGSYGLSALYETYAIDFKKLEQEYSELVTCGNFLLFAIPKADISEYVYLSTSGGPKITVDIEGVGETDDMPTIMETLRYHPEKISDTDRIEFCLVMTDDAGNNPASGIKSFAIPSADPALWDAFIAKNKALRDRIIAENPTMF